MLDRIQTCVCACVFVRVCMALVDTTCVSDSPVPVKDWLIISLYITSFRIDSGVMNGEIFIDIKR